MKKLSKNICIGLLGISFLISSPLITKEVLNQSPDTRAAETPSVPSVEPETLKDTESDTTELTAETEFLNTDTDDSLLEPIEATLEFVASDASYFDDALMIGDSRMEDIRDYGTLDNADYLCAIGLSTYKVTNGGVVEGDTLEGKCSRKNYGKIYIMLGQNEVADSPESFRINLTELLEEVKEYAPDALIFLMANLHVSKQLGIESPLESNERLNVLNEIMEEMCDNETIFYLDVNPIFDDDEGYLPADASGDGVHPYATYYPQWCDWLCEHTITEQSRIANMPEFHFGQAIQALRQGRHVSRKSWENNMIWLELTSSDDGYSIQMKTAEDKKVPWTASQEDMLAEDWFIIQSSGEVS